MQKGLRSGRDRAGRPKPLSDKDLGKVRSVGVEPTINHATGEPALAPYCVTAYSAPLRVSTLP